MFQFIIKAAFAGTLIATISHFAKNNPVLAVLLTAFPLTTTLAVIFVYYENPDPQFILKFVINTFIVVFPSLFFYLIFIPLLKYVHFSIALTISVILTAIFCYTFIKYFNISF